MALISFPISDSFGLRTYFYLHDCDMDISLQTKYRLYLVLDFINGGHLFFQLYHQGLFRFILIAL